MTSFLGLDRSAPITENYFNQPHTPQDICLKSKDLPHIPLYVNRMALSFSSPFFRKALQISDQNRMSAARTTNGPVHQQFVLDVEYDVLREMLFCIHHFATNYYKMSTCRMSKLRKMYNAAVVYEVPCMLKMCKEFIVSRKALKLAHDLNLYQEKNRIINKMGRREFESYLFGAWGIVLAPGQDRRTVLRTIPRNQVDGQPRYSIGNTRKTRPY